MKLHMTGAHPHLQDKLAAANTEDHTKTHHSIEKKQVNDPSSDVTCPNQSALNFSSTRKMSKDISEHITVELDDTHAQIVIKHLHQVQQLNTTS